MAPLYHWSIENDPDSIEAAVGCALVAQQQTDTHKIRETLEAILKALQAGR
jgi:hypothetical protein